MLTIWGQTNRPEFKPAPEVPAMPKALMKLPRTDITRAKFPAVDFHLHGTSLKTAEDYQKMIADDGSDRHRRDLQYGRRIRSGVRPEHESRRAFKDRIIHFARLNYAGDQRTGLVRARPPPSWSAVFEAGAAGLKIGKELGLDLQESPTAPTSRPTTRASIRSGRCARSTTSPS